ncbi:thermonuclease family protein [Kitasatospora sp. NPDC008115]|uniref:thermonuclease family protein n=1 Tax=Kitasatospora sp. NPDC008115 TaxID=3364022 RepID=UPI0036E97A39
MPMLLVHGTYDIVKTEPDGDTIAFIPTDPNVWDRLRACPVDHKPETGRAKLRLESVDALETHYEASGPRTHQPLALAHQARNELLKFLGFTDVEFDHEEVKRATPANPPGWILTRGADSFGRCVALVGTGMPPGADGTQIPVDVPLLRTTANHRLIADGLAYPTFYKGFFDDLREELRAVARQARADRKGVWEYDVTTSPAGAYVPDKRSLTKVVMVPKLFRRLVEHYNRVGEDLSTFPIFLAGAGDTVKVVLPTDEMEDSLVPLVHVLDDSTVRMTADIENLVFQKG